MHSNIELDTLNLSWFGCFKDASMHSDNFLNQMTLVTVDKLPLFSARPPLGFYTFFQEILNGQEPLFSTNLKAVKALFIQSSGTGQLDESYRDLQERINTLGRHIFTQRKSCICSCMHSDRIGDFEVRHFAPNALPAVALVERGLPNHNLNMCWLNAALMLLTMTNYYDPVLTDRLDDPILEALRSALCRLIQALRLNYNQLIVNDLHSEVVEQMKESGFCDLLQGQQDAAEFLLLLQHAFKYKRPDSEVIHSTTVYESFQENIFKPARKNEPTLRLMITANTANSEISISSCLTEKGYTEGISSYCVKEADGYKSIEDSTDTKSFTHQELFTHLPNTLEVIINKQFLLQREGGFQALVQEQLLTDDTQIVLYEHSISDTDHSNNQIQPKTRCVYKITTSIEQVGSTIERGHYIANARINDTIVRYSDMEVKKNQNESLFRKSYLLLLECIERTELTAVKQVLSEESPLENGATQPAVIIT